MSAFGRVVALIGLILIGFGLFTPILCPPTGCDIPEHSFINTKLFEDDFVAGLTASQPAVYLVIISVIILLAMFAGHRFAMLTASLMLITIIVMYLIQNVLTVTIDGATLHLGWGWSLLMVGGVLLIIATVPKSDQLLDEEGYDDYYDDGSPQYDPQQGSPWQQPYPQQPQQTMMGGWQQQQMPPPPPQQPMLASGMVAGMYGTNAQLQPMQSSAMQQTPPMPQRPQLPAQPPPDPLRKTEPDLLNRERASIDSRQLSRTGLGAPARPSVPSPTSSQQQAARRATPDKESTNEFATPQTLNQVPNAGQQQPSPVMTGVINRPSPASKPRAVDQSSQALIKTMISEDSKTIMPDDLKPPPSVSDATEPDRNVQPDPPPMPRTPPRSSSPVPAPTSTPVDLDDGDEVDLMRVTGMIRAPKPPAEEDVDLMRATGNMRPPKPAASLSQAEIDDMDKGKTTRAFGKGPPIATSNDRAALLLNLMDDEAADNVDESPPPPAAPDPPQEEATQSFGTPVPSQSSDRAAFLLTSADEEEAQDDHATNFQLDDDIAAAMAEEDLQTMMPPVEADDSLPFGVPMLDKEYEQDDGDEHTQYPEPELEDSQQYGVSIIDDDDADPEEENDTDPDLRDAFDEYAAALLKDKEDTGPYDVPMLEEDEDDDDNFQTTIAPD